MRPVVIKSRISTYLSFKPLRANEIQWISTHIPKPIPPTLQPNRVRLDIPPRRRIVVPVQAVRQPRFFIKHLPRIPQVELHGFRIPGTADRLAVTPVARGGTHLPKPRDQPLPGHLPLLAAWECQMVVWMAYRRPLISAAMGMGPAGRRQADDLGAVGRVKTAKPPTS